MKIKRKVQKNLPQLIEYIFANNLKHKWKDSDNTGGYIHVYDDGKISVDKCTVDSTFTVEVEEEITEDTVIDELLMIYDGGGSELTYNKSLNNLGLSQLKSAYIMNDDLRLILIWRDGKLVE